MMNGPRSIIVYCPAARDASRLVPLAKALATSTDTSVTGFHVIPPIQVYADAAVAIGAEYIQSQSTLYREDADRARAAFEAEAEAHNLAVTWRESSGGGQPFVSEIATVCRTSELVLIGQPDENGFTARLVTPADIIMASGRPVLVVPSAGSYADVGKRVLIAWNGSREAARAAFDALPLFAAGAKIHILTSGPGGNADEPHQSGAALAKTLGQHGFDTVHHRTNPGSITVGEEILSRAADYSADMIVLGCYGHTRLRETIFGGVTRDILKHMTVPVLMSH